MPSVHCFFLRTGLCIVVAFSIAGPVAAQTSATRVRDTFTASDGTLLVNHLPDIGLPNVSWTAGRTYDLPVWGTSSDIPVPGDYDRDGKIDIAIWRRSTGEWWILTSSSNYQNALHYVWGTDKDLPVPADYDGDQKTDPAIFRPSTGERWVLTSGSNYDPNQAWCFTWGIGTDLPLVGDFNGDGEADIAVYRPSTGQWFVLTSPLFNSYFVVSWGTDGDIPVPGDYNHDGKTDVAVYRPWTGQWFILLSPDWTTSLAYSWGQGGMSPLTWDIPVPGDYDGDAQTDLGLYRPSTGEWRILTSSSNYDVNAAWVIRWGRTDGLSGRILATGDFDADGKTDVAEFEPSTGEWFVLESNGPARDMTSLVLHDPGEVGVSGPLPGIQLGVIDGGSDVATTVSAAATWRFPGTPAKYGGVVLHFVDENNFLLAEYRDRPEHGDEVLDLRRRVNGEWAELGTPVVLSAGTQPHRLRVAAAGSLIRVYWDDVQRIEATDDSGLAGTRAGLAWFASHDSQARADDFQLDANTPPVVTVWNPSNGSQFEWPTEILVQATASDAGGSIAHVAFYADGGLFGDVQDPPYDNTYHDASVGSHRLRTTAHDNVDETTSAEVSVRVCSFPFYPTQYPTVPASGGAGVVEVASQAGCTWSAIADPNADWLDIGGNYTGDQTVSFTVGRNDSITTRTAHPRIAGHDYPITQAATACTFTLTPPSANVGWQGGGGDVTVGANDTTCTWDVSNGPDAWLSVTKTGNWTAHYTYQENTDTQPRNGSVTIAGLTFTVYQAAGCPVPDGSDYADDTDQCRLDRDGTVALSPAYPPGYLIGGGPGNRGLHIWKNNTTLTNAGGANHAVLVAVPSLGEPILQVDDNSVSNYTISNVTFDGAKDSRTPDCSADEGVNVRLRGGPFLVDHVISLYAPCNSGMEVEGYGQPGNHFTITNSVFRGNGFPEDEFALRWADGLTVWNCVYGDIYGNDFYDNTDVDLIVGGGSNCTVNNNHVTHSATHGFAGLMVDIFPGGNGDHSGVSYHDNTIDSQQDMLAFGIMVGHHPWNDQVNLTAVGLVQNNAASGAVINLQIEVDEFGNATGQVTNNTVWGAQGSWGFGQCRISSDYAVNPFHAGAVTYDPAWDPIEFDNGHCARLW